MKRLRAAATLLLGLLMLVQGFAVSAAPLAKASAASVAETSAMPCHDGDTGDMQNMPCCQHGDCDDMAACAGASLAIAPFIAAAAPPGVDAFTPPALAVALPSLRTTLLLRPPIALHV